VVGAQDETMGSLAQSVEPLVEPVVELIVKSFIVQPMVVQSEPMVVNHDKFVLWMDLLLLKILMVVC